tara:strand:+ start:231 stop:1076 length:846 start_codon:yes stop_codon:yes gene_type:complete
MKLIGSFSGGETSAEMTIWMKENHPDSKFIFANTGLEREETLIFVDMVDKTYDLGLVWIECVIDPDDRENATYKEVNYWTASRKGEPFRAMIEAYGIPNVKYLHCNRETKTRPMRKWWMENYPDHLMAIGIRCDELDRVNPSYKEKNLCYPFAFWEPMTKPQINRRWRDRPFRLELKHYEGNCKTCWKKSFPKLAYIMKENPEYFDFFEEMEEKHAYTNRPKAPYPMRFFYDHKTVADIREMSKKAVEPVDDAKDYTSMGANYDILGYDVDACGSETCEAF